MDIVLPVCNILRQVQNLSTAGVRIIIQSPPVEDIATDIPLLHVMLFHDPGYNIGTKPVPLIDSPVQQLGSQTMAHYRATHFGLQNYQPIYRIQPMVLEGIIRRPLTQLMRVADISHFLVKPPYEDIKGTCKLGLVFDADLFEGTGMFSDTPAREPPKSTALATAIQQSHPKYNVHVHTITTDANIYLSHPETPRD